MTDGHECDAQWTPEYLDVAEYVRQCEHRHTIQTLILILINVIVMASMVGLASYLLIKP